VFVTRRPALKPIAWTVPNSSRTGAGPTFVPGWPVCFACTASKKGRGDSIGQATRSTPPSFP